MGGVLPPLRRTVGRCVANSGKYYLVTGTGKHFKNVQHAPEVNIGLVRLTSGGETAQLLWDFADGGRFTPEFSAHIMSHAARLKIDPKNRVVMHCHPANLLAMTLCAYAHGARIYANAVEDVHRVHRCVPRWRERAAMDALRHE